MEDFNSHAHVGRDVQHVYTAKNVADFNSHAHVGRDMICVNLLTVLLNFNSHAHVGRDVGRTGDNCYIIISTHTPTWGVTFVSI